MYKFYYNSPIGILEIIYKQDTLISLKLVREIFNDFEDTSFTRNIKTQLNEYFSGQRKQFDIKINPEGTEFQKQVWQNLLTIPYGETKSYSDIALSIGHKNAQRAIGSACSKNPIILIIPCHRVISKNGNTGGFAYGKSVKQQLLKLEKILP